MAKEVTIKSANEIIDKLFQSYCERSEEQILKDLGFRSDKNLEIDIKNLNRELKNLRENKINILKRTKIKLRKK